MLILTTNHFIYFMSIHNLHKTKLQFKFQIGKQNGSFDNIPSNVETDAFDPNTAPTTQTPKKVEIPSNLISKGKAAILTGLAMMGTAGAMEVGRVKPLAAEKQYLENVNSGLASNIEKGITIPLADKEYLTEKVMPDVLSKISNIMNITGKDYNYSARSGDSVSVDRQYTHYEIAFVNDKDQPTDLDKETEAKLKVILKDIELKYPNLKTSYDTALSDSGSPDNHNKAYIIMRKYTESPK
jgi:hypothetical protein